MQTKDKILIILSVLVMISLFLFINPENYIKIILTFNPLYFFIILLLILLDLSLRIFRWWVLFQSQKRNIPYSGLIYPNCASIFVNLILPGRVGELIRLSIPKDKYGIDYNVGLSVIVLEQVINVMSLITVTSLSLGLMIVFGIQLNSIFLNSLIPYVFLGSVAMILAVSMLFVITPSSIIPIFSFLPEKMALKIIRFISTFEFGLKNLKNHFSIFWLALGSSIVIWILEGIILWTITIELININFEIPLALFASSIGNLNFLFPILPGAVLQYETFLAITLSLSPHYTGQGAYTVAFTDRVFKTMVMILIGGYSLGKLGHEMFNVIKNTNEYSSDVEQKTVASTD